jgi:hypothetical protein
MGVYDYGIRENIFRDDSTDRDAMIFDFQYLNFSGNIIR